MPQMPKFSHAPAHAVAGRACKFHVLRVSCELGSDLAKAKAPVAFLPYLADGFLDRTPRILTAFGLEPSVEVSPAHLQYALHHRDAVGCPLLQQELNPVLQQRLPAKKAATF